MHGLAIDYNPFPGDYPLDSCCSAYAVASPGTNSLGCFFAKKLSQKHMSHKLSQTLIYHDVLKALLDELSSHVSRECSRIYRTHIYREQSGLDCILTIAVNVPWRQVIKLAVKICWRKALYVNRINEKYAIGNLEMVLWVISMVLCVQQISLRRQTLRTFRWPHG